MAKQPRGKFSPAFYTKRIFNAALSSREDPSGIYLRTFRYCNHFNHERHLISLGDFEGKREAMLFE